MITKEVFGRSRPDFNKRQSAGFREEGGVFYCAEALPGDQFRAELEVAEDGKVTGRVIDLDTGEEYLPIRIEGQTGGFVGQVREDYRMFLERIRVVEGSLGLLIIVASFVSTASPVYSNALQALKKFKAHALLSALGAPVRLLTMLATMPFRALSGYFVGQTATPAFAIVGDVFFLRKELSIPAEPYWDQSVFRRFAILFAIFTGWAATGGRRNSEKEAGT